MKERKKHLRGLSDTLCGIKNRVFIRFIKRFKDVTCERCKKTWEYKLYLAGKFREKP